MATGECCQALYFTMEYLSWDLKSFNIRLALKRKIPVNGLDIYSQGYQTLLAQHLMISIVYNLVFSFVTAYSNIKCTLFACQFQLIKTNIQCVCSTNLVRKRSSAAAFQSNYIADLLKKHWESRVINNYTQKVFISRNIRHFRYPKAASYLKLLSLL